MKKLKAKGMKNLKILHLLFVMIWVVGVIAMTILYLLAPQSGDELYMMLRIVRFIDDALVIPGAVLTVVTAIVYGMWTNWGFFRHRWVTVKWIASLAIIIVGTFYFSPILDRSLEIADLGRDGALTDPEIARNGRIALYGGLTQGSALVVLVAISVLKPWKKGKAKG